MSKDSWENPTYSSEFLGISAENNLAGSTLFGETIA